MRIVIYRFYATANPAIVRLMKVGQCQSLIDLSPPIRYDDAMSVGYIGVIAGVARSCRERSPLVTVD